MRAVLVEPDEFVATVARVRALTERFDLFATLPVLLVDEDPPNLSEIERTPGVCGSEVLSTSRLSMLQGFDRVLRLVSGLDDEWSIGGVGQGDPYPYDTRALPGVTAPPAICAAVNVSLTPEDDALAVTSPSDSVNHVTCFLSRTTVPVFAAGNNHIAGAEFETLSPWAEPSWVLAVGATTDEGLATEAPYSARSTIATRHLGPDVLAFGASRLDRSKTGTSFAASRVSQMVALARLWLIQLTANVNRERGGDYGVPLVGVAMIDKEFVDERRPYERPAPWTALSVLPTRLSMLGVDDALLERLGEPTSARRLVEHAAVATSPCGGCTAPAIGDEALMDHLDSLSVRDVSQIVQSPDTSAVDLRGGDDAVFPEGASRQMRSWLRTSMPIWEWEVPSSRSRHRHDQNQ